MFGIDDAISAGLKVLDKFIPDPAEKAKAEAALRESLQQWDQMQATVNAKEAENTNVFVSGWRPFIGWVCGFALVWTYILQPMATFVLSYTAVRITNLPTLDMGEMMPILLGMLGLGGLRTYEKINKVAAK